MRLLLLCTHDHMRAPLLATTLTEATHAERNHLPLYEVVCVCCSELWEKWQLQGATAESGAEAEEYDSFINSLLERPDSAQNLEAPAPEPEAPAPEDLPGFQRTTRAPSPVVCQPCVSSLHRVALS